MRTPFLNMLAVLCLAVLAVATPAGTATAGARMALVVGMSNYENVTPLKNATQDARTVGATLEKLGFDVTTALDLKLADMVETINRFSFRSETADIALIYYAGHGIELHGENYLIPTDITLTSAADIGGQAITINNLLEAVRNARKLKIVILDSCRNNPFLGMDVGNASATPVSQTGEVELRQGGLAPPSPDQGTLVVYAAKAGEIAFDGEDGHSPFARALIEQLPSADLEIGMMFRKVRDAVMLETRNQQEPYFYGSLSGIPFFLSGSNENIAQLSDRRLAWGQLGAQQELQLASLANEGNVRALIGMGYLSLNPDSNKFDPKKAFESFTSAAERGDAEAMFELGKLYEKGIGIEQDFKKAVELYKASADLGFSDAINDLGFLYYQGAAGLKRDEQKAVELFLKAADLRHPQAMYNTASLIDDGVIAGKTSQDAARYLYHSLRSGVSDVLDQLTRRPTQFKVETRKALQEILAENAFYEGAIDGDFGKGTQRGMKIAFGE